MEVVDGKVDKIFRGKEFRDFSRDGEVIRSYVKYEQIKEHKKVRKEEKISFRLTIKERQVLLMMMVLMSKKKVKNSLIGMNLVTFSKGGKKVLSITL